MGNKLTSHQTKVNQELVAAPADGGIAAVHQAGEQLTEKGQATLLTGT